MSYQFGRGFRNPLLRRVRQHSTVSTLFRAPSAPQPVSLISSDQQSNTYSGDILGVVQATLGSINDAEISTPTVQAAPQIQGTLETSTPQIQQVQTPATDIVDARPIASASPQVHPARSISTQRAPAPDTTTTAPQSPAETSALPEIKVTAAESDPTLTDTVWRRLQTIFRRHQSPSNTTQQPAARGPDESAQQEVIHLPSASLPDAILSESASPSTPQAAATSETPSPVQRTSRPAARIQRSMEPESKSPSAAELLQETAEQSELTPFPPSTAVPVAPASTRRNEVTLPGQPIPDYPAPVRNVEPGLSQPEVDILETAPLADSTLASSTSPVLTRKTSSAPVETSTPPAFPQRTSTPGSGEPQVNQMAAAQVPLSIPGTGTIPSPPSPRIQRMADKTISQDEPLISQTPGMDAPPVGQILPGAISSPEINGPIDSGVVAMDSDTPQQTAPLQDVWQVEHRIPKPGPSAPVQSPRAIQRDVNRTVTGLNENISRVLDGIAAGGPTASSIEVVAPRYPRPVPRQVSRRAQQPTIMREPAAAQEQRRTAVGTPEHISPVTEDVVDTAIGPLPADLWTLIDEPVPPTVRSQSPSVEQESGISNRVEPVSQVQSIQRVPSESPILPGVVPQVQREREARFTTTPAPSERAQPAITSFESQAPQTPARIQRVAEQYGGDTQTSAIEQHSTASLDEGTPSQEQDESKPEGGSVDIDDLARKVYAEVKRKLSVEWERLRTRF